MYQLSHAGETFILNTLLEVLSFFETDDRFTFAASCEIALTHCGQPVTVTYYNDVLTVRRPGTVRDLFLSMIDEIDGAYFRPNGTALAAWQIQRSHWKLLYDAFDLTSKPLHLFSSNQIEAANAEAGGRFDLHALLQSESQRRFGFRYAGPEYGETGQLNGRHEVHVGYALALGLPVPEPVIAEYCKTPDVFKSDMTWGRALVDVPELRGAIPPAKLQPLVSIMSRTEQKVTSENAALLAMVMRLAPNEPTHVEVDDLLFRHGLVEAHPLPDSYSKPVALGEPVSRFAEVVRRTIADARRDASFERVQGDRAAGGISQRWHDHQLRMAQLDHGRETFLFGNELSDAVDNANIGYLLDLLDRPDDWNRGAKKAVREAFGIKLIGVRAAARRRAIFALAGLNEEQQAEWEAAAATHRETLLRTREAKRAVEAGLLSSAVLRQRQPVPHRAVR